MRQTEKWLLLTLQWIKPGYRVLEAGTPDGNCARVWLNGEEVSRVCSAALVPEKPGEEGQGWAYVLLLKDGYPYAGPDDEPVGEVRYGLVRWERMEE